MRRIYLFALAALLLPASLIAQAPKPAADLVYINAWIFTGEGMWNNRPHVVDAIAIKDGKILAVGTNADIKKLIDDHTVVRDLTSLGVTRPGVYSAIYPGLNDAHTHLGGAGRTKLHIDLTGTPSLEAMLKQVGDAATAAPAGHWLIGGNWDHTLWQKVVLPTRQDLDRVTGDHPAFLDRIDGHIAIANTAALKAAGITGKTTPPEGGAIDLDPSGNPTGILRESAQELIYKIIPPPSHDERVKGAELTIQDALSHGITSVQDFSDWQDFLVFEELEKEGKLNLRISEWLPFVLPVDQLIKMRAHHPIDDPMLHTGMLKGFMDGSLGSHTAALKAPYADEPNNSGLPQLTQEELNKMAVERTREGFQLGFHAIGDRGTAMALEAFELSHQDCVTRKSAAECANLRDRVEHAQVVDPADIPRFAKLGVIASMQPNHLLTDMNWAEDRLGPQRAAYSYAWKAFLKAGAPLAFGTDYPVEPITPFRGLYAAVTRKNEAGTKTYYPQNRLTRGEALAAYTQGSAYAEFAEKHKGLLLPGYDADLVLFNLDPYTINDPDILKIQVLETVVNGKIVYQAEQKKK
jgi:predicted amidohydrolase YtcJ